MDRKMAKIKAVSAIAKNYYKMFNTNGVCGAV
jgi:hypothetical protein